MSTPDYSGFEEHATGTDLELVTGLAMRQQDLEAQISEKEEELKAIQAEHREVSWKQLPELMQRLNLDSFSLANGYTISINEKLRLSLPAANKQQAMLWVDDNGGSALVKRAFIIEFSKDQEKFARKFQRDCAKRKNALPMEESKTVHSSTLTKFISDKLKNGDEVPLELFGAYQQRISKIKHKK